MTKDISQATQSKTFEENAIVVQQGGEIVGGVRKELEAKTGKKVVSGINAKSVLELKKKE